MRGDAGSEHGAGELSPLQVSILYDFSQGGRNDETFTEAGKPVIRQGN